MRPVQETLKNVFPSKIVFDYLEWFVFLRFCGTSWGMVAKTETKKQQWVGGAFTCGRKKAQWLYGHNHRPLQSVVVQTFEVEPFPVWKTSHLQSKWKHFRPEVNRKKNLTLVNTMTWALTVNYFTNCWIINLTNNINIEEQMQILPTWLASLVKYLFSITCWERRTIKYVVTVVYEVIKIGSTMTLTVFAFLSIKTLLDYL